jgi:hypothetical protein
MYALVLFPLLMLGTLAAVFFGFENHHQVKWQGDIKDETTHPELFAEKKSDLSQAA